jgi:hypothetical protein
MKWNVVDQSANNFLQWLWDLIKKNQDNLWKLWYCTATVGIANIALFSCFCILKYFTFQGLFKFRNRKWSQMACLANMKTVTLFQILFLAKYCHTSWWACAVSWRICNLPDSYFCGCLWLTAPWRHFNTCKQKYWLIVWPFGTHSWCITHL